MRLRRTSEAQFELAEILHHIAETQKSVIRAGKTRQRIEQAEQLILDCHFPQYIDPAIDIKIKQRFNIFLK